MVFLNRECHLFYLNMKHHQIYIAFRRCSARYVLGHEVLRFKNWQYRALIRCSIKYLWNKCNLCNPLFKKISVKSVQSVQSVVQENICVNLCNLWENIRVICVIRVQENVQSMIRGICVQNNYSWKFEHEWHKYNECFVCPYGQK